MPLEVQVFDWDRIGTDFMGGGTVDISRLGLNQTQEVSLLLTVGYGALSLGPRARL